VLLGATISKIASAGNARRVLVVDDNVDGATLLAELLETAGLNVQVAHDAAEALSILEEFVPQIAILDIGLPGMDGYELASELRQRFGDACRLIALSGYGQERDRQRGRAAGFDEHLVKPVDVGALFAAVRAE
jgi:DNA-binding response OmpR family regulator